MFVSLLDIPVMRILYVPWWNKCIYGIAAEIPGHQYSTWITGCSSVYVFLILPPPKRVSHPLTNVPLQFKPSFLKCAFYLCLYSTFLSLTIKALYLSANELFHEKIKEAAVIICLALKLILQHTIVHQKDGNYFHGHEFIRGGRKYRKLTIVS